MPLVAACGGGGGGGPAVTTAAAPSQPAMTHAAAATPTTAAATAKPAAAAKPTAAPKPATESGLVDAPEPVLFPEAMSALEQSSPWDLPPEMHLTAAKQAALEAAVLRRRILQSRSLALSPAARKNVADGRVSAGALALLDALPDGTSPFLVFSAKGTSLRVQATTLKETVGAIDGFQDVADQGLLAGLRLVPVAADTYDEGKNYAQGERRAAIGESAVQIALKYLGIPYVWGGSTPTGGFDCSGLVMYVYGQLGIHLHHFTGLQWLEGTRIEASQLRAGDIVFFRPEGGHPGHEGMYIGGGKFIQAPHTGDVVKISDLAGYASMYVGAVRPY
jgi:cell wall-associated NlpC family hydrolase